MKYNVTVAHQVSRSEIEVTMIKDSTGRLKTLSLDAVNGALYTITMFLLISLSRDYFQARYIREATGSGTPIGASMAYSKIVVITPMTSRHA